MLPAQLAIVAEAALGPAPQPEVFLSRVTDALEKIRNPPASPDDVLFKGTLDTPLGARKATEKVQVVAVSALVDFSKVTTTEGAALPDLDAWFVAFGKWTIGVKYLCATREEQEKALKQRKELCERAQVGMREWSPGTLRTYLNCAALLYKETKPDHGLFAQQEGVKISVR